MDSCKLSACHDDVGFTYSLNMLPDNMLVLLVLWVCELLSPVSLSADMMERAIINTFVGHDVVEPGNYVQMFPYPCYTRDE